MQTTLRALAAIGVTGILSSMVIAPFAWFEAKAGPSYTVPVPAAEENVQDFPPPPPRPEFDAPFRATGSDERGPGPNRGTFPPPRPRPAPRENFSPGARDHLSFVTPRREEKSAFLQGDSLRALPILFRPGAASSLGQSVFVSENVSVSSDQY